MPGNPNKLSHFWDELKRRKVIKVMAMYAATAFIIIEAGDIILPRLGLPDWTVTFIIIFLIVGFPITIILSWIFDITPEGIQKTEPLKVGEQRGETAEPIRRKLRLSDIIISVLVVVVCLLAYPKIFNNGNFKTLMDRDGRISIAVMPFNNLTGDSLYNLWQEGLQNLLITSLSNSEELSVRQYETMHNILGNKGDINYASITPTMASDLARKLEDNTVIVGNMHKSGRDVRITINLLDSKTEEIYKSYEIDGMAEDDFFTITDSMSTLIKTFLEIKSLKESIYLDLRNVYTNSTEAYKLYLQGHNCHSMLDYTCAIELYEKAIQIDSNFVSAMIKLAYCYGDIQQAEMSKFWAYEAMERIDWVPHDIQLTIREVNAAVDKKPEELIKQMKQYLEINPFSMNKLYGVGWVYFNTSQWQNAIDAFEKNLELSKRFAKKSWIWTYILLGRAYQETGEYKQAMKLFEEGIHLWPDEKPQINYWQAVCALDQQDTAKANVFLGEISEMGEQKGWPKANILLWYAGIFNEANSLIIAEKYYKEALSLNRDNVTIMNDVAYFLISNDIDIEKGNILINRVIELEPENGTYLYTFGLGLYKQGKLEESYEILKKSWDLQPYYDHEHYLQIKRIEETLATL